MLSSNLLGGYLTAQGGSFSFLICPAFSSRAVCVVVAPIAEQLRERRLNTLDGQP
jgi:hypothetical protein